MTADVDLGREVSTPATQPGEGRPTKGGLLSPPGVPAPPAPSLAPLLLALLTAAGLILLALP